MKRLLLFLPLLLIAASAAGQEQARRYWITFPDKAGMSVGRYTASDLGITEKALARRAKVLPPDRLIDEHDLPVAPEYLSRLRACGAAIHTESRWLNAVGATMTPTQLSEAALRVPLRAVPLPAVPVRRPLPAVERRGAALEKSGAAVPFTYGPSSYQVTPIAVPAVHALGIHGAGVLIGMTDDGFNSLQTHASLKHLAVAGQYDFVQRDSSVERAAGEYADQGFHGTATLSVLGGFDNGRLIGPAYGASYLLAKTEVDSSETARELDYYVEGLEWLERQGADIVSTSLGYDDFNPPGVIDRYPNGRYDPGDIVYAMKNGRTSAASVAAVIATRKGVLVVTAMGNEHWEKRDTLTVAAGNILWQSFSGLTGSVVTPADADSILSVGATYSFGEIATFSGTGPTADGRIKPEVVAPGVGIVAALHGTTDGYYGITPGRGLTQGTSFSTPLTAGAAALVLSAHPELTPMQVRQALMATTSHPVDSDPSHTASWPNNFYGWGMIDALSAVLYHGIAATPRPLVTLTDSALVVTVWMRSNQTLTQDSLALWYRASGSLSFTRVPLRQIGATAEFEARVPRWTSGSGLTAFLTARDAGGRSLRIPSGAGDTTFALTPTSSGDLRYYPKPTALSVPAAYALHPNFPNPFNSTTVILFDLPAAQDAEVAVFNLLGERMATLRAGQASQGTNSVTWNGRTQTGVPAASGVYFYRLRTPNRTLTRSMLLVK